MPSTNGDHLPSWSRPLAVPWPSCLHNTCMYILLGQQESLDTTAAEQSRALERASGRRLTRWDVTGGSREFLLVSPVGARCDGHARRPRGFRHWTGPDEVLRGHGKLCWLDFAGDGASPPLLAHFPFLLPNTLRRRTRGALLRTSRSDANLEAEVSCRPCNESDDVTFTPRHVLADVRQHIHVWMVRQDSVWPRALDRARAKTRSRSATRRRGGETAPRARPRRRESSRPKHGFGLRDKKRLSGNGHARCGSRALFMIRPPPTSRERQMSGFLTCEGHLSLAPHRLRSSHQTWRQRSAQELCLLGFFSFCPCPSGICKRTQVPVPSVSRQIDRGVSAQGLAPFPCTFLVAVSQHAVHQKLLPL